MKIRYSTRRLKQEDLNQLGRLLGFQLQLYDDIFRITDEKSRVKKLRFQKSKLEQHIKNRTGFVAVLADNPQACLLYEEQSPKFYISDLFVQKHLRGLGIGRNLISQLAKHARIRSWGIYLHLPSRNSQHYEHAKRFYESLGFEFRSGYYSPDKMTIKPENLSDLLKPKS